MAMKLKQTSGCNLFVMLQAQLRLYVQAAGQVLNEYIKNKMGIATVTVTYAIKITHTHVNMNACTVPKHIQPCFPIDFVMCFTHYGRGMTVQHLSLMTLKTQELGAKVCIYFGFYAQTSDHYCCCLFVINTSN